MKLLAIDQSLTATSVAGFDVKGDRLKLIDADTFYTDTRGIIRIAEIKQFLIDRLCIYNPKIVVREMHMHTMKGAGNAVAELNGVIDNLIYESYDGDLQCDNFRYYRVPGTVWKKYVTGKGTLKKDTAYLKKLLEFINKHDILIDDDIDTDDDNIADAICLGMTAWRFHQWRVNKVASDTKEQQAMWVRNELTIFNYGDRGMK